MQGNVIRRTVTLLWSKLLFSFIVGCLLIPSTEMRASHIVGGELYYTQLNDNWDYEITLKVYRDCGPTNTMGTGFDDPASIGVFDAFSGLVMNLQLYLFEAEVVLLPIELDNPCLAIPPDLCVERCVYTAIVSLPPLAGGYNLVYQRCCRNATITNLEFPQDTGATYTTQIPDANQYGNNSCPRFINFPPVTLCINEPFSLDHSATDPDGDSLVYEFCTPLLGADNVFPQPNPPSPPPFYPVTWANDYDENYPISSNPAFVINAQTGLITGTPDMLGQFVVGVCVSEYRNGQLLSVTNRDFQFNVAFCSQGFIAEIVPPDPCTGLALQFDHNSDNALNFLWNFGVEGTESDTTSVASPFFTFPEQGLYEVMLIINTGSPCADTTIVEVPVFDPMEIEILSSGPVCANGMWTFDFIANGSVDADDAYSWSFPGGNPSSSAQQFPQPVGYISQGTYSVTVLADDGYCTGQDVTMVDVPALPYAEIAPQTSFCDGLTISFDIGTSTASTFYWDFGDFVAGDNSDEENPSYTYSQYGTYLVTLTADPGSACSFVDQQEFQLLPDDPIESYYIVAEPDICDTVPTVSVLWYGTGATSIEWSFGDGSTSTLPSTQYVYEDNGIYTVTLTALNDLCGYDEEMSEEISIGFGPILAPVLIPNVFTPSGDHKNEHFRIYYENEDLVLPDKRTIFDYMSYYHLRIFDRWGILVYDSNDDSLHMWDGDFHGDAGEGVYYFIVDYQRKCVDHEIISKDGHLTLLRNSR